MKYLRYHLTLLAVAFVIEYWKAFKIGFHQSNILSDPLGKENCILNLSKGKFSMKIPSEVDNYQQNLLIRSNIPKSLAGEYLYKDNRIIWNGDINPSSIIIKPPNKEYSLSLTISKAIILFDPINVSQNTHHELLVITDDLNSDSPMNTKYKVYFSFKIQIIEEIVLMRLNSLIKKGKQDLNEFREGKKEEEKKLNEINNEFTKLTNINKSTTFDSILMNFTNFRYSNTFNDRTSPNDTSFDFSNYNFDVKSVFDYVGSDLIAYQLPKDKHLPCRKSKENIYVIQFDKSLPITKEFSDRLLRINTEIKTKIGEINLNNNKNNFDVTLINIDKNLVYKSSGKNKIPYHKPVVIGDFVTTDESVNNINSYSSWRNTLIPKIKENVNNLKQIHITSSFTNNNNYNQNQINPILKKKLEMFEHMFGLLDQKYKILKDKYYNLNKSNSNVKQKPCLTSNKPINKPSLSKPSSNKTCQNLTEIFQGPVHFNNYQNISYPDNFKIIDNINNLNGFKLPTIVKRENIGFDNGTVLIFQTIMIDTKNKTTEQLEKQYENFHKTHMIMKPKNGTFLK
jgi:hypothetical protein